MSFIKSGNFESDLFTNLPRHKGCEGEFVPRARDEQKICSNPACNHPKVVITGKEYIECNKCFLKLGIDIGVMF